MKSLIQAPPRSMVALITPFKPNGRVDYKGYQRLVEFQLEQGIDGLVLLGTTAETPNLEKHEQRKLVTDAFKWVNGRIPIVVGTGSSSHKHTIYDTNWAYDSGAYAVMVVTPYYIKPNDSGLMRHFESVAGVGARVIVYNIAGRAVVNITTPQMQRIAKFPNIIGVKEASGNLIQQTEVINTISKPSMGTDQPFYVWSGDDGSILPVMRAGGYGGISVAGNAIPGEIKRLTDSCAAGDFALAQQIHDEWSEFFKLEFIESNPVPIKRIAANLGLIKCADVRLHLGPLSAGNVAILDEFTNRIRHKVMAA